MSSIFWEKYSRISGKKQELLLVVSKTALSVWRKSLREHISDFFLFLSRVSELDTSSEEKIFKEKYIAWVKSLYLPFYVSLTELHLRVQRNVSFRSTLLEFFHQFMILRRTLLDLVKLFWTSFSKVPSMSPQDLLKVCFFSGKTTDLLIILDLWAKTFGFLIKFFQQNCENGILRVQMKK